MLKSLIFNRKSGEWASPFLLRPLGAVGVSPLDPARGTFFKKYPLTPKNFQKENRIRKNFQLPSCARVRTRTAFKKNPSAFFRKVEMRGASKKLRSLLSRRLGTGSFRQNSFAFPGLFLFGILEYCLLDDFRFFKPSCQKITALFSALSSYLCSIRKQAHLFRIFLSFEGF